MTERVRNEDRMGWGYVHTVMAQMVSVLMDSVRVLRSGETQQR